MDENCGLPAIRRGGAGVTSPFIWLADTAATKEGSRALVPGPLVPSIHLV